VPLMRPIFLEFPNELLDDKEATNGETYMFGRSLFVAPKEWPFQQPYEIALPPGDWFDYWTGEKHAGAQKLKADPPLDLLPVYVRAGSIIPEAPVVQNVDETPKGPLTLRVYPGPNCSGDLYSDDGNTLAYQKGEFVRVHFTCEVTSAGVNVRIAAPEGPFQPWFKEWEVVVYSAGNWRESSLDGKPVKPAKSEKGTVRIEHIPLGSAAHDLELR